MARVWGQVVGVMVERPVKGERLSKGFDSCDTSHPGGTG